MPAGRRLRAHRRSVRGYGQPARIREREADEQGRNLLLEMLPAWSRPLGLGTRVLSDLPPDRRVHPRMRRLPGGTITPIVGLFTESELKTSPACNEAFPRYNVQNGLNVRLDGPGGSHIAWCIGDAVDADGWSTSRIRMVARMLPHLPKRGRLAYRSSSSSTIPAWASSSSTGAGASSRPTAGLGSRFAGKMG